MSALSRKKILGLSLLSLAAVLAGAFVWLVRGPGDPRWTPAEREILRSLWIGSLPPPPSDPSNAVSADSRAARLGHRLFFDARLSANERISCASCHDPARHFTDGRERGRGLGDSARNTMSLVGAAYSPWFYWDGRKDSLWSQALSPLEDVNEHGLDRLTLVRRVLGEPAYRHDYELLFGPAPDFSASRFPAAASPLGNKAARKAWEAMTEPDRHQVNAAFANLGKAIAAYERLLLPASSRFDAYVEALLNEDPETARSLLTIEEAQGLRLFIGEARCTECHNGPLLSNQEFHNTGILSAPGELPDRGRGEGLRRLLRDPFNCLGEFSDAPTDGCAELRFARSGKELLGAHRTPSLRNLADTAPFMHKGQLSSLAEVLEHYNEAPASMIGHNEAKPLRLSRRELRRLEAFLHTLDAPLATAPQWLAPPAGNEEQALLGRP